MPKKSSHGTLGSQMRGALARDYGSRGDANAHLWFFFSPKGGRDFGVPTDLQFGHVLLVESDPRIKSVDYSPPLRRRSLVPGESGTVFDAEAHCYDGSTELHEVKPSSALVPGADERAARQLRIQASIEAIEQEKGRECRHVVLTEEEIFANPIRIRNWFEALAWMAQARNHSLYQASVDVAVLLHAEQRCSFGHLLRTGGPLYIAAALKGVAHGKHGSDLNEVPLTERTVFMEKRRDR